jgi:hypothetical protein
MLVFMKLSSSFLLRTFQFFYGLSYVYILWWVGMIYCFYLTFIFLRYYFFGKSNQKHKLKNDSPQKLTVDFLEAFFFIFAANVSVFLWMRLMFIYSYPKEHKNLLTYQLTNSKNLCLVHYS